MERLHTLPPLGGAFPRRLNEAVPQECSANVIHRPDRQRGEDCVEVGLGESDADHAGRLRFLASRRITSLSLFRFSRRRPQFMELGPAALNFLAAEFHS